jgi:transposase InsO family protein
LDLFTVDLLDGGKAYVLAAIEHATRRIRILGATTHPGGDWIVQQGRNLLMDLDDAGAGVKFVLHDRDGTFHEGFDAVFTAAGMRIVRSGVRMPRMNSIMERWIGGCRRELLDRTLIWNLPHLRRVLAAYERHHNEHRPHRFLHSAAPLKPLPPTVADLDAFRARRHDRIAGVIHEYQQAA